MPGTESAGTDTDGVEMSSFLQFSDSTPAQSVRKILIIIFIFTV